MTYYVTSKEKCQKCGGNGRLRNIPYMDLDGEHVPVSIPCDTCQGTGEIVTELPLKDALVDLDVICEET